MGDAWLRLGAAAGLAAVGFMVAGPIGAQIGFLAGSVLGSMVFPQKTDVEMPKVGEYPVQNSGKGIPVPIIYGTVRAAGNIIWMGALQPYTIKHGGGGGKGGGGDESVSYETKYRRSFLIGICEGPATILRCWKGKTEIPISSFTQYSGTNNEGISALLVEDYAEYKNICCVYFENYDLGNAQGLPNFVFEVRSDAPWFGDIAHSYLWSSGISLAYYVRRVEDDGSELTMEASVNNGNDGAAAIGSDGTYIYGIDGNYLEKYDQDMNAVAAWQAAGRKNMGAEIRGDTNALAVEPVTGNVVLSIKSVAPGTIYLLDSDGDEIWNTRPYSPANTYWYATAFTSSGDILVGGYAGTGKPGGFLLSKNDGSIIATFANDTAYQDLITGIDQNPLTNDIIFSGTYKEADGVFAWPLTGGGPTELLWSNTITLQAGQRPYFVFCHTDGSVFVGTEVSTNPVGSVHKYTSKGTYVKSYNTGNFVMCGCQRNYGDIVIGGYRGTNEDGATVSLSIFTSDLEYLRGLDYGAADVSSVSGVAAQIPARVDNNPAEIVYDMLTNSRYGAGISGSSINGASFIEVGDYCEENNLKISLVIDKQKPLWDWIDYICSHFGGYRYRSGGKICLGVFKNEDSAFTLTQDNLVISDSKDSSPPVQIRKRKYTETYNRIEIQWTDRDADYDSSIAVANDEVDQRISVQIRKKTINLIGITDATYAQKMAYRMLIESMYRHSFYAFALAYKNMLLEVNDVGTISDGFLLTDEKIRITSVSEDKDGKGLAIEAIEDGSRLYPSIVYASQQTGRAPPTPATLVNARIMFREDNNDRFLYLSMVPGNSSVSGYNIYRSYDDSSYEFIGRATIDGITAGDSNSYGTLESNLPAYPSVVYRGEERLLVDIGTVTDLDTSIADDTFFDGRKILRIGNELIGYYNCEETSVAGVWKVTGLIRGLHNTLPEAHSVGDIIETLDVDFTYVLNESEIGVTLYFKAVVFYANQTEDISDVTAYSYSVSGKHLKPLPVSLMRINGREGLTTYKTDDIDIDWYFCSKVSGFGRGGYGNALWGAYLKDPLLELLKVELEEEDGIAITDAVYTLSDFADPPQLEILAADRSGKNPVRIKMTPGSHLWSDETRDILVEKI